MKRVDTLTIGTRGSALALWQANHVADLLRAAHPDIGVELRIIETRGDRVLDQPLADIGSKGLFTAEIEAALRGGEIDCAVHSLKDLPVDDPPGLILGAVPQRAALNDVLIARNGLTLATLPHGAVIGTDSKRRAAQLLFQRPDLAIKSIRGNVPTRIDKLHAENNPYDAIMLAQAGVDRLGLTQHISEILPLAVMLNAPGQGALAVQCRDEPESVRWFTPLGHAHTRLCVTAERAFLGGLGGGCSLPVAAHAVILGDTLALHGRVNALDGGVQIDVKNQMILVHHLAETSARTRGLSPLFNTIEPNAEQDQVNQARQAGETLAELALKSGVGALLETNEA